MNMTPEKTTPRTSKWTEEEVAVLIAKAPTMSLSKIADMLHKTRWSVYEIAFKHKVETPFKAESDAKHDEDVFKFSKKHGRLSAAAEFGITVPMVKRCITRHNKRNFAAKRERLVKVSQMVEPGKCAARINGALSDNDFFKHLVASVPMLTKPTKRMDDVIETYFLRTFVSMNMNMTLTAKALGVSVRTSRNWLRSAHKKFCIKVGKPVPTFAPTGHEETS